MQKTVDCYADSGWAGDREMRKSRSSANDKFGKHLLESASNTQQLVAVSSGEAEFYALFFCRSTRLDDRLHFE